MVSHHTQIKILTVTENSLIGHGLLSRPLFLPSYPFMLLQPHWPFHGVLSTPTCWYLSSRLFCCLEQYSNSIVMWFTPSLPLHLFKMLPLQNSHLTELARISTSSSHYPSTCNHALSSPEIIYTCTHMCTYTYLYANLLYELYRIFP